MVTTPTVPGAATTPPAAPAPSRRPFGECVNYETVYRGLESRGIHLDQNERSQFEGIFNNALSAFDGGSFFSGSGAGNIQGFLYRFVSFLEQCFSGQANISDIGSILSGANNASGAQTNSYMLSQAMETACMALRGTGNQNLINAAALATDVTPVSAPNFTSMPGNVSAQVAAFQPTPVSTNLSLDINPPTFTATGSAPYTPPVPMSPNRQLT